MDVEKSTETFLFRRNQQRHLPVLNKQPFLVKAMQTSDEIVFDKGVDAFSKLNVLSSIGNHPLVFPFIPKRNTDDSRKHTMPITNVPVSKRWKITTANSKDGDLQNRWNGLDRRKKKKPTQVTHLVVRAVVHVAIGITIIG